MVKQPLWMADNQGNAAGKHYTTPAVDETSDGSPIMICSLGLGNIILQEIEKIGWIQPSFK